MMIVRMYSLFWIMFTVVLTIMMTAISLLKSCNASDVALLHQYFKRGIVTSSFTQSVHRSQFKNHRRRTSFNSHSLLSFIIPNDSTIKNKLKVTAFAPLIVSSSSSFTSLSLFQSQQEEYKTVIQTWQGSSHSSSPFVTHFIAGPNNSLTVKEAIQSILPLDNQQIPSSVITTKYQTENNVKCPVSPLYKTHDEKQIFSKWEKMKKYLLQFEHDAVFSKVDAEFRHTSNPHIHHTRNNTFASRNDCFGESTSTIESLSSFDELSFFSLYNQLSPAELVTMGCVWYLSAQSPRDPSLGGKPIRLELKHIDSKLNEGDYLRVHHTPRRFPNIHNYDFGKFIDQNEKHREETSTSKVEKDCDGIAHTTDSSHNEIHDIPGVIVAYDKEKGYIIVNKPPNIPVHPTVENRLENVASAVGYSIILNEYNDLLSRVNEARIPSRQHQISYSSDSDDMNETSSDITTHDLIHTKSEKQNKQKNNPTPLIYVVTPQRLDQNTSGLLTLATKHEFAAYFAKLLRNKTDKQLLKGGNNSYSTNTSECGDVYKKYKCLVCIMKNHDDDPSEILENEVNRLRKFAEEQNIIRHYLEDSIKAPKYFTSTLPPPTYDTEKTTNWLECLLKIIAVDKNVYSVNGDDASIYLSKCLWPITDLKPKDCVGVVEVEVELLTGRTHQIRGQLSLMGFPLCGDAMYGGSIPKSTVASLASDNTFGNDVGYLNSELLALQCCELSFPDPDYVVSGKKGKITGIQSDRFNRFRLERAWWTPYLETYLNEKLSS